MLLEEAISYFVRQEETPPGKGGWRVRTAVPGILSLEADFCSYASFIEGKLHLAFHRAQKVDANEVIQALNLPLVYDSHLMRLQTPWDTYISVPRPPVWLEVAPLLVPPV